MSLEEYLRKNIENQAIDHIIRAGRRLEKAWKKKAYKPDDTVYNYD
jgi:hypothetical protein